MLEEDSLQENFSVIIIFFIGNYGLAMKARINLYIYIGNLWYPF